MSILKNGCEYLTSGYGNRTYWYNGRQVSDFHLGVDVVSSKYGTDYIVAFDSGKVVYAGNNGSYGNVVYIDHGNGQVTDNGKEPVKAMVRAWNTSTSSYTLDSVYNSAPTF